MDSAPVSVNVHKPSVPVLWLDTSVGIKFAKIVRGENLQQVEIDRLRRLKDTALRLTRKGVLLCPQSDQREEYEAGRIEEEVSREFLQVSQGIRMIHRQGIFDQQLFHAMQSYVSNANVITLPLSVFFLMTQSAKQRLRVEADSLLTFICRYQLSCSTAELQTNQKYSTSWRGYGRILMRRR